MLTHVEAENIVKDCIAQVRGFGGGIDSGKQLKQVGIQTADQAVVLRDVIATDTRIGVPSIPNHRIKLTDLNVSTAMKVLQLQNTVLFFAFEIDTVAPLISRMTVTINPRSDSDADDVIATAEIRDSHRGEKESSADSATKARDRSARSRDSAKSRGMSTGSKSGSKKRS
jgi:hypothetical protein